MRYSHLLVAAGLAAGGLLYNAHAFAGDSGKNDKNDKNDAAKHEKQIQLNKLPAAARDTVTREAKGGKLVKVEEMTKDGRTVYEALIRKGGEETAVDVDQDGKVVDRHMEKNDKSEKR